MTLDNANPFTPAPQQPEQPDSPNLGRTALVGGFVVIGFFGVFLGWAGLAPLESAAMAPGTIVVEGNRKTIQHLEGGIIADIRVRDGDTVAAGDLLARLDSTKAKANLDLLASRYLASRARESRLLAEQQGRDTFGLPANLSAPQSASGLDPKAKMKQILEGQQHILKIRRQSLAGQAAILGQRIAQHGEEIKGLKGQISAEDEQFQLILEEIAGIQTLFDKGLAPKPQLLALKRRAAEIKGSRNLHRAQIARAGQSITESKLRISELRTSHANEVAETLRETQEEIYDLEERIRAAEDVLKRTEVRAPLAGIVVEQQIHTTGGVIPAGATLMDIVPASGRRVIEARINPRDIDVVSPGLPARMRLTAFDQRSTPPAEGIVRSVSADRLTDINTGETYYLAIIAIEPASLPKDAEIHPGMQAEVMIVTGRRPALAYFFEPILRSLNRAFREG